MPAGAIHLHEAVGAGRNAAADFGKLLAHCFKVE